ncbi:hypothetical protein G8J24_05205 [Staphylococcus warneri]|uniref:Small acid-soluble spore protein P n=1 Tax=Staphylococcus warneri TaxID=1292 RepID=A0ABS9NET7_STAWA|nr:hypothetical protein [Staphylococcus warneri]MCG6208994.1 hypothetical protein [Staphylococcus warneri]MCG6225266.1 hypothetical protein [Staphylococcus warneri]MCG6246131.1 hypothetical protein [Staphylococcus warneri]MCG6248506.1 hypothetical protein [Staphylococcus warneri]MCG6250877.1 hypothetical protein [Staphylococcus warneri]
MSEDKRQQYIDKDPGHRGGGGPGREKRSNEPLRKSYRNHSQEHSLPNESRLEEKLGKDFRKDRK